MNTRINHRFATLTGVSALVAAGLFAGVLLTPGTAAASPDYPDIIQAELGVQSCVPQCIICHVDNLGGRGTVKKPFGVTLTNLDPPLLGEDNDRLRSALAEVEASGTDSDGDGEGDIIELTQDRDPSVPGAGDMCELDVRYGCGARVEPRAPLDWSGALAAGLCALGLGFLARRRWAAR